MSEQVEQLELSYITSKDAKGNGYFGLGRIREISVKEIIKLSLEGEVEGIT